MTGKLFYELRAFLTAPAPTSPFHALASTGNFFSNSTDFITPLPTFILMIKQFLAMACLSVTAIGVCAFNSNFCSIPTWHNFMFLLEILSVTIASNLAQVLILVRAS